MSLTREQIDIIRNLVRKSITIPTLRDDVTDHLWCEVERNISETKPFSLALNEALEGVPSDQIELCKEVLQKVYDNLSG